MISHFTKNFKPQNLSHSEFISEITQVIPFIVLPQQEQVDVWEFVGNHLNDTQKEVLTLAVNEILTTESQKKNYAKGITFISLDYAKFNESLDTLKSIPKPDNALKQAIESMNQLQKLLDKKYQCNKKNIH